MDDSVIPGSPTDEQDGNASVQATAFHRMLSSPSGSLSSDEDVGGMDCTYIPEINSFIATTAATTVAAATPALPRENPLRKEIPALDHAMGMQHKIYTAVGASYTVAFWALLVTFLWLGPTDTPNLWFPLAVVLPVGWWIQVALLSQTRVRARTLLLRRRPLHSTQQLLERGGW